MRKVLTILMAAMLSMSIWGSTEDTLSTDYLCFTATKATTILFYVDEVQSIATLPSLEMSRDKTEWQDYNIGDSIHMVEGSKVYFRATSTNSTFSKNIFSYIVFSSTDTISASGNIMSLLNKDCSGSSVPANAFCYLFDGCRKLTHAPRLPASSVGAFAYAFMFAACPALEEAPELPATTLGAGCYSSMFVSCTKIEQAPELPATTLAGNSIDGGCYSSMFMGCTSLKTAPALPATKLSYGCYSDMFRGCTSLKKAPELLATTAVSYCYSDMFYDCTGLTEAPELFTTNMEDHCYYNMFHGCKNIQKISVHFTQWSDSIDATTNWVDRVSSTGEFICPDGLAEEYGANRIPTGWTVTHNTEEITAVDQTQTRVQGEKIVRNGQVLIRRQEHTYDLSGRKTE